MLLVSVGLNLTIIQTTSLAASQLVFFFFFKGKNVFGTKRVQSANNISSNKQH